MLGAEYGALRPWELNDLTPLETRQLHAMRRYYEEQRLAAEGV